MKNVKITVKGSIVTIEVDMSKRFGVSKTGKSQIIASTGGSIPVPGHEAVKIGLNVYTSNE